MDLKETLLSSYLAFDAQDGPQHKLQDQRAAAIEVFERSGWPASQLDAWLVPAERPASNLPPCSPASWLASRSFSQLVGQPARQSVGQPAG